MGEFELAAAMLQMWVDDILKASDPKASPLERGLGYLSAIRILEEPFEFIEIPQYHLNIAKRIVQRGYRPEELEMAQEYIFANSNWMSLEPAECIRCGKKRSVQWRKVIPLKFTNRNWRLFQPENHVPICRHCTKSIGFYLPEVRSLIGEFLWGPRFRALWRFSVEKPYDWENRVDYPLWPSEYGGEGYWDGSGHASFVNYRKPPFLNLPAEERFRQIDHLLNPNQSALFSLSS